jgi:hypothetical protein
VKASVCARNGVATELIACYYSGPRRRTPLPMNVSALTQIQAHWNQVLQRIRTIRAAFTGRSGYLEASALDLWRIAHAAVSLVSFRYLERRASPTPVADAALFKATAGIKYALRHAGVARLADGSVIGSHPNAAALWDYIDRERLLIGSAQVCAGPEAMIRELLDVLVDGGGNASPAGADDDPFDTEKLLAYADLLAVWETVVLVARAEERDGSGGRVHGIARTLLREICAATGFVIVPDVELARNLIEAALRRLFGCAAAKGEAAGGG